MTDRERAVCLVLGSTGKVGLSVLKNMAQSPSVVVRAAVRSPEGRSKVSSLADEIVDFEFEDPDCYDAALDGVSRLFLLTGYSVDMLHQSKILIDKAADAGVRFMVHLGTHAPDNTAFKHHAWHQLVERYIEWRGIEFVHLRPAMFMVNILDYAKANMDQPGVLIHYTGDTAVAWVAVEDIGRAAASILLEPEPHAGQTYFLDSEALSMGEVASILQEQTGQAWKYEHRDASELMPRLLAAGREMTYASSGIAFFEAVAAGLAEDVGKTHPTLELLLGARPIRWREYAEEHADEFRR